jgi:hypothetical protein
VCIATCFIALHHELLTPRPAHCWQHDKIEPEHREIERQMGDAATPAAGWEKGQVENQVGLMRLAVASRAAGKPLPLDGPSFEVTDTPNCFPNANKRWLTELAGNSVFTLPKPRLLSQRSSRVMSNSAGRNVSSTPPRMARPA